MKQLNVFCEGQTEQGFCTQVLQPHLFPTEAGYIHTLAVGKKGHSHLYGLGTRHSYERLRKFIVNTITQRQGPDIYFTTLLDLYALPADFPGKAQHKKNEADPTPYVLALEQALEQNIGYHKFIAYLQLHEFETLLLVQPEAFHAVLENADEPVRKLRELVDSVPNVEHIDDGPETAPSKRIESVLPAYAGLKATAGPDIAASIGLPTIRQACPHVDSWLRRLEAIFWSESKLD